MKITLDLSRLVEDGKITPAEAERLTSLASHETGSLGINILVGFGVVAVAAGAVAMAPAPLTAILLGIALFAVGCAFALNHTQQWGLLGQICLLLGALMFSGGVYFYGHGSLTAMLIVTAVLAVAAVAARSGLLAVLAVLAASACLGARTGYSHAVYSLAIFEPTLTVVLFSALALLTYTASRRLPADYERLALAASRTSVVLVNFGFWIGSLWGDPLFLMRGFDRRGSVRASDVIIPSGYFTVGWALALIAVGFWGVQANRRWVVNIAAAFGAIHFYTQWFERLGATPLSVLLGGLLMLLIALALWSFNRRAAPAA